MKTIIKFFGISILSTLGLFLGAGVVSAQSTVTSCTSATLNGTVTPNGNPTTAWFEWGTSQATVSSGSGTKTATQTFTTNSSFTQSLAGLSPSTTYYYRAMASNVGGVATGSTISFNTSLCGSGTTVPTVTMTADQTNLQYNNATYVRWNPSTNATSCNATGGSSGWSGARSTSVGSFYTGALTQTTTYSITCTNSAGSASDSVTVNVTTQLQGSQPTVSTNSATNLGQNNATLNGIVNGNGLSTTAWFEWGTTSSFGNTTSQNNYGTGSTNYNTSISGLSSNTTYYYRAVAQNSQGTVYGNVVSFTTMYSSGSTGGSQASVSTISATSIAQNNATLNGIVNGNGYAVTAWFEWGTSYSFGNTTSQSSYSTGSTNYNMYISGLAPNTTYYYRAVAQSSQGIVYGNTVSFATTGAYGAYSNVNNTGTVVGSSPTAVTTLATQISNSSAQLNALIFASGGVSSNAWFEWGTNAGLGNMTPVVPVGSLPTIRHADTISGLVSGTTFYYRAVAENSYGKSYGLVLSFVADGTTARSADTTVVVNQAVPRTAVRSTTIINRVAEVQPFITLNIDGGGETILPNESRTYHVTWKNDSNQNLKKVVLRVLLPASMTFNRADRGVFTPADNTLTLDIKTLAPGEIGELTLTGTASPIIPEGELVVVVANLVYTNASNVQGDALAYATHRALHTPVLVGASIFGAGSFLPTSLVGWILLLALMLLLLLLAETLYGRFSGKEKSKK